MFYSASEDFMNQAAMHYVGLRGVFKCGALRKRASEAQLNAPGMLGTQMNAKEEC